MSNPFGGFRDSGTFGSHHKRMMPCLFGVRDPFDDPFFTRPFGQSASYSSIPETIEAKGVIVDSDHEGDEEDSGYGEDEKAHNFSFQTCNVTYGDDVNGAYYTSTRTRRAGRDGVVFEESKEADRTTGQATHRISKGIHDKGHSVARKFNSDGKVDIKHTLHNLNEDELNGFEKAWKGNLKLHMPGWRNESHNYNNAGYGQKGKASWGSRLLPSAEHARNFGGTMPYDHQGWTTASKGRTKNGVRINIE
ncbi:hypothetical protein LWI28_006338 [Acer negundo]|uniref:Myeloid leukemia factor 1 n=1 Tax=Acer negundo TaxID=4023 RepID=A0AAD5NLA9_ACENE|nr:hypothetical protein LWI28_006338 [Acer negundo]KAK4840573.1 hypothetical protein QYF36_012687 [Acer negundo]